MELGSATPHVLKLYVPAVLAVIAIVAFNDNPAPIPPIPE